MMKKYVCTVLAILLTVSLTACGSGGGEKSDSQAPALSSSQSTSSAGESGAKDDSPSISFEGLTVVDNDVCAVKITEIEPDNMWGFTLKTSLENRSADKTYMYSVQNAAVNGVQTDSLFAQEVAPGKKANGDITFMDSQLRENGVGEFTDIELTIRVYDTDDWMADAAAVETVHIYPYGEENAVTFVREAQPADQILIDNEYATVIVTGYTEDSIWGYTANLFLVNKADTEIMVSVDNASINGYMADPFFAKAVTVDKCTFTSMSWSNSILEENGITSVDEIEFTLRIYDNNNWMAGDFANEVITLNP